MRKRSLSTTDPHENLTQEALQLGPQERVELVKLLIDSLDPTTEQDVEVAWLREVERRTAALDAGSAETIPWEAVRARLRFAPP